MPVRRIILEVLGWGVEVVVVLAIVRIGFGRMGNGILVVR